MCVGGESGGWGLGRVRKRAKIPLEPGRSDAEAGTSGNETAVEKGKTLK